METLTKDGRAPIEIPPAIRAQGDAAVDAWAATAFDTPAPAPEATAAPAPSIDDDASLSPAPDGAKD